MLLRKIIGGALLCLKTLEFLSFHIVQETSMIIEAMAFRCGVVAPVLLARHSMTEPSMSQVEVSMWASPSLMMIKFHNLMADLGTGSPARKGPTRSGPKAASGRARA